MYKLCVYKYKFVGCVNIGFVVFFGSIELSIILIIFKWDKIVEDNNNNNKLFLFYYKKWDIKVELM